MKKALIQQRQKMSQIFRQVENDSKTTSCLLCNKKLSTHCNSHIVPRFVLEQISEQGKVCYGATFFTPLNDIVDTTKGLNNAFTFKMICNDCDKKRFSKYETPNAILNFENFSISEQKNILSEMAIKNHLAHIWMKRNLLSENNIFFKVESEILKAAGLKTAHEIDIEEHLNNIKKITNYKNKSVFPYEILFNEMLEFSVGIATQTLLSYVYDLDGNKIFDRTDFRSENIGRYFYLTIFPYHDKTRIIFYIKKVDKPYVYSIIKGFNSLSHEDKIHFLFISLITLDEQFYVKPSLAQKMKKNKKLIKLYKKTDGVLNNWKYCKEIKNFKKYRNYLINDSLLG